MTLLLGLDAPRIVEDDGMNQDAEGASVSKRGF